MPTTKMRQFRRISYLPLFLLLIGLTGGCALPRLGSLTLFENPTPTTAERYEDLRRSSLADPAIKREDEQFPFNQTEPIVGGVYLPSLSARITATEILTSSLITGGADSPVSDGQRPLPPTAAEPPTDVPQRETTRVPEENRLTQTTNILILGSDRRPIDPSWRTDVIMLLALDLSTGQAGIISFPRDIYLEEIPGHQPNRINVVDYLGEQSGRGAGPQLLSRILSENLGLPIDHYVRFEFESFKDVVDALGGVTITVDCAIYDEILEENLYINLAPGEHVLSGDEALAYVRTRRLGGDLERIRRQQRFIWALRQQFLNQNWLSQISTLYTTFSETVETDIGPINALTLVRFALNVREDDVHGLVISPPNEIEQSWQDNMFVFLPNWSRIAQTMETVFERAPFASTNTVGPGADQPICPQ